MAATGTAGSNLASAINASIFMVISTHCFLVLPQSSQQTAENSIDLFTENMKFDNRSLPLGTKGLEVITGRYLSKKQSKEGNDNYHRKGDDVAEQGLDRPELTIQIDTKNKQDDYQKKKS